VIRWRLRTQFVLASGGIVVVLIGATLWLVSFLADRFVSERLDRDLRRTQEIVASDEHERFLTLQVTAELIASFPELRALLDTDAATIRDFLVDYQRRAARGDLLVVLDPSGRVMARTDAVAATPVDDAVGRWIEPTLAGQTPFGVLDAGPAVYEAVAVPAEAGGHVFGFLLVGGRVDDAFARRLRDASNDEIVVLGQGRVLGSTLDPRRLPFQSAAEWDTLASGQGGVVTIEVEGSVYAAVGAVGQRDQQLRYVALQSLDRAFAPYRSIQVGLLGLGLIGAIAGIAASAFAGRSFTAPLVALADATRRVADGEYDVTLEVARQDEVGELARAFNVMTRGLRERAAMQKFVSQSTIEMIRQRERPVSGGERRLLTILISDIRGFTAFADACPPEDAVRALNRCLGLQAECVRRFGGDVDKFVGDSVVALFRGDDMALDAIRCAIDIHRALEAAASDGGMPPLGVGIGIATGEVVLGSVGSGDRLDFTAIGSHVNLASRLCAIAEPREVLLAAETFERVGDLVAAERIDPVTLKGFQVPVTVYRMAVRS
jgi:class 3 adenylate cyclase